MCETFQYRLENDFRALAGNGHAHLFPDALLTSLENVGVRERLEPCPLPIGEGTGLRPVVHVRSAAAASRHGV